MPHSQGDRNHQQRRVFRGRGGPTDGNLPPKKTARPKVKYQAPEQITQPARGGRRHVGEDDDLPGSDRENVLDTTNIQQLSLDNDEGDNDPLLQEISHLQKRILNVQLSLQTSQGLSNPKTWRTNCLMPVRNAVKEWRSILLFHCSVDTNNTKHNGENNDGINGNDHHNNSLNSSSQKVFGLIQMTMQSGPLVGSNPGYFKRCGGEVASMAYEFLSEIVQLAEGVNGKIIDAKKCIDGSVGDSFSEGDGACETVLGDAITELADIDGKDDGSDREENGACARVSDDAPAEDCQAGGSFELDDHSLSESSSSSSCSIHDAPIDSTVPEAKTPLSDSPAPPPSEEQIIMNNLQNGLLFSEKQSQRFCQWLRNAHKAMEKNQPPSKSAKQLQSQKSKKQKQKELKMERKMKKKKKGGSK